jgi:hypothetical protein
MLNDLNPARRRDTSAADGTLMMLLSMNLLLLVFFMMLNSMGTYGAKHAQDVLAQVREGYDLQGPLGRNGRAPALPMAAWQQGMSQRLQGLSINRLKLIKPPMEGSAQFLDVVLPLDEVFNKDGSLAQPATIRNLLAAAGEESTMVWQVEGDWETAAAMAVMAASLAAQTGQAQVRGGDVAQLRLRVYPGGATSPDIGLAVQRVGEDAGGTAEGVQEGAGDVR